MEDKTLLNRIIASDHTAFRMLAERYCDALFVFAVRTLGDDFAAKDIVQDAFETIWKERRRLKSDLSIKSYLYGIVRNKCLDIIRLSRVSEKYRNSRETTGDDMMANFIETETMRLLVEGIETLPTRSAEVIRLSLEGLRQEHIAERMGIAVATVKALKAEGIKKLRRVIPLSVLSIFL